VRVIREQTDAALDVLIHLSRVTGGRRKLVRISEVTGMEGQTICLHDLFRYKQLGVGPDGHARGQFEACGIRPKLMARMEAEGIDLPLDMFRQRVLTGEDDLAKEGEPIV